MKRHLSARSLGAVAVVLAGMLAMPSAARGQRHRTTGSAGTPRTASVPAAPRTQGGNSGTRVGGDSGGGQDRAVARPSTPQPRGNGGRVVVVPADGGFVPWGLGYGGYYGGYYGAYDPWYGWYPTGAPTSTYDNEGSLRLKVKPVEASVYADGYYVGIVDDFNGIFQRLHLDSGPHRIEIRAPGYETLTFDVRIEPDHTTTYRGELVRQP